MRTVCRKVKAWKAFELSSSSRKNWLETADGVQVSDNEEQPVTEPRADFVITATLPEVVIVVTAG